MWEWAPRTQKGHEARIEAHRENKEKDFSEGGGSKQYFLLVPGITVGETWHEPAKVYDNYW